MLSIFEALGCASLGQGRGTSSKDPGVNKKGESLLLAGEELDKLREEQDIGTRRDSTFLPELNNLASVRLETADQQLVAKRE
jgi:hypothetical protein